MFADGFSCCCYRFWAVSSIQTNNAIAAVDIDRIWRWQGEQFYDGEEGIATDGDISAALQMILQEESFHHYLKE